MKANPRRAEIRKEASTGRSQNDLETLVESTGPEPIPYTEPQRNTVGADDPLRGPGASYCARQQHRAAHTQLHPGPDSNTHPT